MRALLIRFGISSCTRTCSYTGTMSSFVCYSVEEPIRTIERTFAQEAVRDRSRSPTHHQQFDHARCTAAGKGRPRPFRSASKRLALLCLQLKYRPFSREMQGCCLAKLVPTASELTSEKTVH